MNKKDYIKYSKSHAPSSPFHKNFILAFLCGGTICTIGQCFFELYTFIGIEEKNVKMLVSSTLVILSCVMTAIGIYDKIAKHCGAGTLVPITGFANAMMSPVMDYKSEGVITGAAAKMFIIAGPVIVYGVISSMIYGLIYYVSTLNII
ncbi:MAG: SpoVA/SpoVAEb family sporulation membrane protein [Ruminococcaceae bacterium]|nr:SpoVA/SpoVAEb family sporulation membrane protein [Oscillospiraceae bacterium]